MIMQSEFCSATSGIHLFMLQGRQRQQCLQRLQHLWRQLLLSAVSPSYGLLVPGNGALPASMLNRLLHRLPQGAHELQVRTSLHSLLRSGHGGVTYCASVLGACVGCA